MKFRSGDAVVCVMSGRNVKAGEIYHVDGAFGTEGWLRLDEVVGHFHPSLFMLASDHWKEGGSEIHAGDRLLCVDDSNTMGQLVHGVVYVAAGDEKRDTPGDRASLVSIELAKGAKQQFFANRFLKIGGEITCGPAPLEFLADVEAPVLPTDPVVDKKPEYRQWWLSDDNRKICSAYLYPNESVKPGMTHVVDVKILERIRTLAAEATGWTSNRHVDGPLVNIVELCDSVSGPREGST